MMTDEQRNRFIAEQLNAGVKLNDIQRLLETEHGVRMTYLDLRMLAAELEVDWQRQEPPKPAVEAKVSAVDEGLAAAPPVAAVTVTVNKLARPDAAISGSYQCPSGARGEWIVDHYGRPGLIPAEGSPKPTAEEMKQFQQELVRQIQGG